MRTPHSSIATIAACLGWLALAGTAIGQTPTHVPLDGQGEPLRSTFNADAGKPRVLLLVSPT